ncbi:MAG: bifunctional riboflavin kinase/FAD synthetase [Candidatus Rokuibacteriota bacterium]
MRIVRGLESFPPEGSPAVVALGLFDGIHLGHRAILGTAVARGRELGITALACTFDPRPMEVLHPDRASLPITTLAERLALIAQTGIDIALVLPFSVDFAAVEPEAFVKEVLVDRLQAREVVVGFNHRFGRGARGDAALLEALGKRLGFRSHVVPPLTVDGVTVSSTEIRTALRTGEVERAARFLGRAYSVVGTVVQGAGRGRTLGFPTANVAPEHPLLVAAGVYACHATVRGTGHPAVVNVGVRPTFGEDTLAVEAHLLDFAGDLYGQPIRLDFVARLREERRFPGVESLRSQISLDVAEARRALRGVSFTS